MGRNLSDGRQTDANLRNLYLQPNANADNAAIKAKANKSTHQNLGVVAIDVDNPPTEDEFEVMARTSLEGYRK